MLSHLSERKKKRNKKFNSCYLSMEVIRRQSMMSMNIGHHALVGRSKSLPVQVLQMKRRSSIDRLNREHRVSLQIELTCSLMTSKKADGKGGIHFQPSILMQVAVTNGDESEMNKLISEHGRGIIDEREPTGLPPIMRSIFEGQVNSLQLLIDRGADLTARDPEEWNVLHVAAAMDDYEAAELILSYCSPSQSFSLLDGQNVCGQKPVELAEEEEMVSYLREAESKVLSEHSTN